MEDIEEKTNGRCTSPINVTQNNFHDENPPLNFMALNAAEFIANEVYFKKVLMIKKLIKIDNHSEKV